MGVYPGRQASDPTGPKESRGVVRYVLGAEPGSSDRGVGALNSPAALSSPFSSFLLSPRSFWVVFPHFVQRWKTEEGCWCFLLSLPSVSHLETGLPRTTRLVPNSEIRVFLPRLARALLSFTPSFLKTF